MKVGDLVRYGNATSRPRNELQKIIGIIIDVSGIMMCSWGVDTPYKTGSVRVMWPDHRLVARETFADLEVIS